MRMFPYYCDEKYRVAVKCGNKRTSKNFYYRLIGYKGVEFVKNLKSAHTCTSEREAKLLVEYLKKRIREVGFVLREPYI